jgi:hypothetical protein
MSTDWTQWAKDTIAFEKGEMTGHEYMVRRGYTAETVMGAVLLHFDLEREVRKWLHDDPELIARIDVPAVVDALVDAGVTPEQVNTNELYDFMTETVEQFDSKADER